MRHRYENAQPGTCKCHYWQFLGVLIRVSHPACVSRCLQARNRVGGRITPPPPTPPYNAGPRTAVPGSPCGLSSTLCLPRRRSLKPEAEQLGELLGQLGDVLASTSCFSSAAGDGRGSDPSSDRACGQKRPRRFRSRFWADRLGLVTSALVCAGFLRFWERQLSALAPAPATGGGGTVSSRPQPDVCRGADDRIGLERCFWLGVAGVVSARAGGRVPPSRCPARRALVATPIQRRVGSLFRLCPTLAAATDARQT